VYVLLAKKPLDMVLKLANRKEVTLRNAADKNYVTGSQRYQRCHWVISCNNKSCATAIEVLVVKIKDNLYGSINVC